MNERFASENTAARRSRPELPEQAWRVACVSTQLRPIAAVRRPKLIDGFRPPVKVQVTQPQKTVFDVRLGSARAIRNCRARLGAERKLVGASGPAREVGRVELTQTTDRPAPFSQSDRLTRVCLAPALAAVTRPPAHRDRRLWPPRPSPALCLVHGARARRSCRRA